MALLSQWLFILLGVLSLGGGVYFSFNSWREGEKRAAWLGLLLGWVGAALWGSVAMLSYTIRLVFLIALALLVILLGVLWALPVGKVELGDEDPESRVDERDIMFARARLKPGSPEYVSYYAMRPQFKQVDDRARSRPGLLSAQARLADMRLFASPVGSFGLTEALRDAVDGPVASERIAMSPQELTQYLKSLAIYYGALQVGVAKLKPAHIYSHIGRGSGAYGDPVKLDHTYALAFTVEMDYEMVGTAPAAPITMESARQYVEAARVAVQLAGAIRALGYPARAHIDGNYRVIAPLVGRDAGLGEIGRMGLLMAPHQGPRVRLGVVTTSAPLIPDGHKPSPAMIDFCNICLKCAENCPSRSIPFDERKMIDGALRWQIHPETCYQYWTVIGTDCGRCMAVCPFSHPDTYMHNLVRWGIKRSGLFRRLANWLDDVFYGKHPARRDAPDWVRLQS